MDVEELMWPPEDSPQEPSKFVKTHYASMAMGLGRPYPMTAEKRRQHDFEQRLLESRRRRMGLRLDTTFRKRWWRLWYGWIYPPSGHPEDWPERIFKRYYK